MSEAITMEEINIGKKALLSGWGEMTHLVAVSAKEVSFQDMDGKQYIDCTSQAWSLNTGFSYPRILKAVRSELVK